MKVAYISGKYRDTSIHRIVENIRAAEAVALKYWRLGYAVICPHKNTALMDGAIGDAEILDGDLELVRRSDVVVMLPNWTSSAGAALELDEARAHGKEIVFEASDDPLSDACVIAARGEPVPVSLIADIEARLDVAQKRFAALCDRNIRTNHERNPE